MVFIETEDGTRIGPIKFWGPTRTSKRIKKIILTDGNNFYREIHGYDYYAMSTEALTSNNRNLSGLTCEIIYGILDLTSQKKDILDLYNDKIKRMSNSKSTNLEHELKVLRSKYDDLIKLLDNAQVCVYSMVVSGTQISIKDAEAIHEHDYKEGIPIKPSVQTLLGNSLKVLN